MISLIMHKTSRLSASVMPSRNALISSSATCGHSF